MPPIDSDSPPTIDYASLGAASGSNRGFPWGVASLTLGVAAAVGIPLLGVTLEVTRVVRGGTTGINVVGVSTALVAISCGLVAARKRRQRALGIAGCVLGYLAIAVVIPSTTPI